MSLSPGENDSANSGEEPQRDKRLRTTITPEQLEILYQKYLLDSNPTRKMLDHIAHEVGLKKRVVQVWFQNTRARERKGHIDSGDRPGQKRFRTQMTNLQLKVLKSCFNDYRTPTMLECEVLGNDIGLPKRVVQVWFQNARAGQGNRGAAAAYLCQRQ
uniref:Homeobox domain-containing protein n=1 Tax=Xiphophorus couchianus TaxID=32473 RepID=A0A3B5KXV7_9TELE